MAAEIAEVTLTKTQEVGFKFYFRKSTTSKISDPVSKKISDEVTVEASLAGNADSFAEAMDKLSDAQKYVNERLASER